MGTPAEALRAVCLFLLCVQSVLDPQKAAAMLKAAGYEGRPVRILATMQYDYMYKVAQVAQPNLEEAGFKVDLQVMDWATLLQKRADPANWDIFVT